MLGLLEVSGRGGVVELARGRERTLLALLLLHANEPISSTRLIEELWADQQPEHSAKALQVYVSRLRKTIGAERLKTTPAGYVLHVEEGELDVHRFEQLTAEGRAALEAGDPERALRLLSEALALWRGPALADFRFDSFAQTEIRRLEELQAAARADLIEARMAGGRANGVIGELEQLVAENPLWERPRRQLMLALYRDGRQADALELYRRTRSLLADELGIDPSPELQALERAILNHDPDLRGRERTARRAVRPRGRRRLALGGLLIGVAAAAVPVTLLRAGGRAASIIPSPDAIAAIDARTNRVVAVVPVGGGPTAVAAGDDAVWVATGNNSVSRIDPATKTVRQTIPAGEGPAALAVTRNAVWVANGLEGTVSRIDPESNQLADRITAGNGPSGIAFAGGTLWVANSADGTVSRIEPISGRVTGTFPVAPGVSAIAAGFGRVWALSPPTGSVIGLDSRTGQIVARVAVGVDPAAVAAGARALWVANRADGTVSKIDPATAAVVATIRVGRGPAGVAAAPGVVWVANAADGTVSRIDPSTDALVTTIRIGNSPRGLALTPTRVYVAVRTTGLEHRGGTLRVSCPCGPGEPEDLAYPGHPRLWWIHALTNDGLVAFRRVGGVQGTELVPDLAASLPTISDGGRTYVFRLRRGIRYSTGRSVRPEDFRRAIERLFEQRVPDSALYTGIIGARRCVGRPSCDLTRGIVTDRAAGTVAFHLAAPDADFLTKLALPPAFAVPAVRTEHGPAARPATGPYRIAVYDRRSVRLVRNPKFRQWSADAQPDGFPNEIAVSFRTDGNITGVRAVERGAADLALLDPGKKGELERLARRHPARLHSNTARFTSYFFLDTRAPPFDDLRVRRALNDAFDRQTFSRLLGRGYAPTCQIFPPNFPGYKRTCPYLAGGARGLEVARRAIRSSGTAGSRVTVWVPSSAVRQGPYMVSLLNTLGYRARLKVVATDSYFPAVLDARARVQIGYIGWASMYPSAVDFIRPMFSCAGFEPASPTEKRNPSQFCVPSLDAQMDAAAKLQAADPPAAVALWQRVERRILAHAPVVPTTNPRNLDFTARRVGNYQYHPQWGVLLGQLWVK